ncbi:hypothetical protein ACFVZD_40405, partial [Streptomyces sp. NPDC058287]
MAAVGIIDDFTGLGKDVKTLLTVVVLGIIYVASVGATWASTRSMLKASVAAVGGAIVMGVIASQMTISNKAAEELKKDHTVGQGPRRPEAAVERVDGFARALRRLGWTVAPAEGVKVNDRIVRMAQEQAGRVLRSAKWRTDLTAGVIATWPDAPEKRTPAEWDAVRDAMPGGRHLPSSIIKGRTRQITKYWQANGRLPVD